jgi:hypothetical protein
MKSATQEIMPGTIKTGKSITIHLPHLENPIHVHKGDLVYWDYDEQFTVSIIPPWLSPAYLQSDGSFTAGPAVAEELGECLCIYSVNSESGDADDTNPPPPPPNTIIVEPSVGGQIGQEHGE